MRAPARDTWKDHTARGLLGFFVGLFVMFGVATAYAVLHPECWNAHQPGELVIADPDYLLILRVTPSIPFIAAAVAIVIGRNRARNQRPGTASPNPERPAES